VPICLSGSMNDRGNELLNEVVDLIVFVSTPAEIRLARWREREARHFGAEAISVGSWRHEEAEKFIEGAVHYEDGTREGRRRSRHEAWLSTLGTPFSVQTAAAYSKRSLETLFDFASPNGDGLNAPVG
jgi:hypothetical protein